MSEGNRPIIWRLHLGAAPERVFAAWLAPADHVRFWCEHSEPSPAGFRLQFIDGSSEECRVERTHPPAEIVLRYFGSRVRIVLAPAGGGTDLTLTAGDVAPDEWEDVFAGWVSVLLPFKAWVDFGVDLRNHDRSRTWRERYVDQ